MFKCQQESDEFHFRHGNSNENNKKAVPNDHGNSNESNKKAVPNDHGNSNENNKKAVSNNANET